MIKVKEIGEGKVSLLEIRYEDEIKGIKTYGRLFPNSEGKLDFEGDATESAMIFFETLKSACQQYFDELSKNEN